MIPTECKMPDISDLEFPLKKPLLLTTFIGDPGLSRKEALYRRNFVRLIDKSIKSYLEARNTIIMQIEEFNRRKEGINRAESNFHIIEFTDFFEDCINAIARLLKQLDSIKTESGSWQMPKDMKRSIVAHSKNIPDIRNAAEHMDEIIQRDELQVGQPVMLAIGGDGDKAILGPYEVRFDHVAMTIRRLHNVARILLGI